MTDVRVFINGTSAEVPAGATALEALQSLDPLEAAAVSRGDRAIADSRGLPVDPASPAYAGAIYRTVRARAG